MIAICDECKRPFDLESEFFLLRVFSVFKEKKRTFAFPRFLCRNCLRLEDLSERALKGKRVIQLLQKKYGVQIEKIEKNFNSHQIG